MTEPSGPIERTYTLGYALASLDGLFQYGGIEQALSESWLPRATYSRYGRKWYLSRMLEREGDIQHGRIGFVRRGLIPTVDFDDEEADFVKGVATSGTVVPFAISLTSGKISYQLRSGIVTEGTFIGALSGLLNLNSRGYLWNIRPLVEDYEYRSWISRVDRVTEFNFKLERPNPHYHDDEIAERIIEEFRLQYAVLTGVAREGEGIDTDSTVFQQALDHVLRGYGTASLAALDPGGGESRWVRTKGLVGAVLSRMRIKATGGDEAPTHVLTQALDRSPAGALTASLDDDDHDTPEP